GTISLFTRGSRTAARSAFPPPTIIPKDKTIMNKEIKIPGKGLIINSPKRSKKLGFCSLLILTLEVISSALSQRLISSLPAAQAQLLQPHALWQHLPDLPVKTCSKAVFKSSK